MTNVNIDSQSGFCGGVIRAIETAQNKLKDGPLYSLGAIVHNEEELSRLEGLGLMTTDKEHLGSVPAGSEVLIRAHGEPPRLYEQAASLGLKVVDCTCPVVLALQKKIREAYSSMSDGGQLVIFGKTGHPEVLGLIGQVEGDAIVISSVESLEELLRSGRIDVDKDIEVFSQTTMSPPEYERICRILKESCTGKVTCHDSICRQVASRHRQLQEFARSNDAVIFVAGRNSSNGKVLFELCRQENPRSFLISSPSELKPEMLEGCLNIGVCGATSTPKWLLEETADNIRKIL